MELTIGSEGLQGLSGESIKTAFGTLTITSVDGGTISFSYALDMSVDNDTVAGATDTSFVERIPVTVRDATSSSSADIAIDIRDDAPVASLDPAASVVIEEASIGTPGASLQFSLDMSGSASHPGADVPATQTFALNLQQDGVDSGLRTTDGQQVLLYRIGSGSVVGRTAGGTDAFSIAVDASTGVVTVTLLATLAHPAGTDVLELAPDILFATTTITDADGDSDTASLDFSKLAGFGDSEPVISAVQNASLANQAGLSVTGHITASAPDGIASFDLSPSLGNAPAGFVYALQTDGSLLGRDSTGASVFTLAIDRNGDYTFTALREQTVLSGTAPTFSTSMIPAGSPMVSASTGLYGSYDQTTGAGIGAPITSVVFSSAQGKLNPSSDGLGIGNNLIDNPRTAPAEVLAMQFADRLSNASITIGNLSSKETLTWKVYRDGQLVDSGEISRTYVDIDGNTANIANSESPVYKFDLHRNGLDAGVLFDRVEISAGEGTSYKFINLAIERPVAVQDLQLDFSVVAKDGDGDASAVATFSVHMGGSDHIVHDTAGDTALMGSEGADVFQWTLAEPGAKDTVTQFSMASPAEGGDALDITDLLPPESAGHLDNYLRFEDSGNGGTLLKISRAGAFTGDAVHDAGVSHQSIDLQHVDFSTLGGSQQQIIDNLLHSGKLITD